MASAFSLLRSKALPTAVRASARTVTSRALLQGASTSRLLLPTNTTTIHKLSGVRYMSSSQALSDILARELAEEEEDGRTEIPEEVAGAIADWMRKTKDERREMLKSSKKVALTQATN